ncbi:MAG: site-specific integrase, partial [Pseudomonadota bacterium]|nr:site-specific integrase [Pseudomonadota bacterium]
MPGRKSSSGKISTENRAAIEQFLDGLWLQSGLSENTLVAYRRDLEAFSRWLQQRSAPLIRASRADLLAYLAWRSGSASARTSARLLSSLRRFYRSAVQQGLIDADPSADIQSPKLGRPLPKTLSEADVEELLG